MKKTLTTLHDRPANLNHNLGELMIQNGEITMGRECEYTQNVVCIGVGSGHDRVSHISGRHAKITYNLEKDIYSLEDAPSRNGTTVKRDSSVINVGVRKVELQDGDELYFAKYGPVVFNQKEKRAEKRDDETRTGVFED